MFNLVIGTAKLYEEVKASDELKKALADAVKAGKVTEFLKANGCDAKVAGGKTYGTRECPDNSHDCSDCGVCI